MVLAYFDPNAQHEVHVDGCTLGVSVTLVQHSPNEDNWRVVQYASRTLSDLEQRYSQIELEMLAVDSACRKFHAFLYGKPFTIFTDHKRHHVHNATENVGANARPGIQGGIISNYTSGHPLPRGDNTKRELGLTKHVRHYTNFVIENSFPKAINKEETVGDNGKGRRVTKTNRLSREACCS